MCICYVYMYTGEGNAVFSATPNPFILNKIFKSPANIVCVHLTQYATLTG